MTMSNIRFLSVAGLCSLSAGVGTIFGLKFEQLKIRYLNKESNEALDYGKGLWPVVTGPPIHIQSVNQNRVSEIMKFGYPSSNNIMKYENFVVSYDRRNRIANWVFEQIKPEHVTIIDKIERSKSEFKHDNSIHRFFTATNDDYKNSGYDRGHLAAAANHRHSQTAMDDTFTLTNVCPQVGNGFNRDAWNDLEKYVRAIARKNRNVYCCTGPLYLPKKENNGKMYVKYEVIGPNHVAVPTHFFKVLLIENQKGQFELLSFVMPNQAQDKNVKLKNFLQPIDIIERAAGILMFDSMPRNMIKSINGKNV